MVSGFSADCSAAAADANELLPKEYQIPLWDESYEVRSAAGYKDNVLLSDGNAKGSGLVDNGVEVTIFRLPLDAWDFHFFLSGDDIRYWRRDMGVTHEDQWVANAEGSRTFGLDEDWKFGIFASYVYINQVLDVFDFVNSVHAPPARIEGHRFTLRPSVQKELGSNYWLRLELDGIRQFLTYPADSFWQVGPRVILGHPYGRRSELTLSYAIQGVAYDHQGEVTDDGLPIPDTSLRAISQTVTLSWKHYWDRRRRWQTTTSTAFAYYEATGSGFYTYFGYGASELLRYSGRTWMVQGRAGVSHRHYPTQTVSDTDSSLFYQTQITAGIRAEKNIAKTLKLFVDYENETSLSNSPDQVYHANTVTGGLDWEF